jgi:hypothetical protein
LIEIAGKREDTKGMRKVWRERLIVWAIEREVGGRKMERG